MENNYRDNGAVGAILDEYELAIKDLHLTLNTINNLKLHEIVDTQTKDEDCRSIQTIMTHVISAGYNYVIEIRNWLGEELTFAEKQKLQTVEEYKIALTKMFDYNVKLFDDYPKLPLEEYNNNSKIKVRWGQHYDVEQLLEHAIVHILRHRRQIKRFILKLK